MIHQHLHSYTSNENIDTTDNQIPSSFPLKVNDEVISNPRNCDGAVFEMGSGTDKFTFSKTHPMVEHQSLNFIHLQNYVHVMVIVRFQMCIIKQL